MVLHHCWLQTWSIYTGGHWPSPEVLRWTGIFFYGHDAVDVFIVISGYSLMLPVLRNMGAFPGGAKRFYVKRFRRIVPPYLAALALSLLLIFTCIGTKTGTHWDISLPVTWRDIVAHVLLVQDVYHPGKINGAMWSIAVEWHIYAWFPLLLWSWRKYSPWLTALVMLALAYAGQAVVGGTPYSVISPAYYFLFVLGMIAASINFGNETMSNLSKAPWGIITAALFAGFVIACRLQSFEQIVQRQFGMDLLMGATAAALLVTAGLGQSSPVTRVLSTRRLAAVGTFSYSLYLVHAPIIQLVSQVLWRFVGRSESLAMYVLQVLFTVPLCLLIAHRMYLLFEKPFLQTSKPS